MPLTTRGSRFPFFLQHSIKSWEVHKRRGEQERLHSLRPARAFSHVLLASAAFCLICPFSFSFSPCNMYRMRGLSDMPGVIWLFYLFKGCISHLHKIFLRGLMGVVHIQSGGHLSAFV